MRYVSIAVLVSALWTGCGRGGDRQEEVNGLRSLGALVNPLVSTPSVAGKTATTVEVTFYASIPLGQTATLTPFLDTGNTAGAFRVPLSGILVESGTEKYDAHNTLQIFSQKVLITIPTTEKLTAVSPGPFIGAQLTYGLTITASGAKENAIGNLLVFPVGATQLFWVNPTIKITAPASAAAVSLKKQVSISASLTDGVPEDQKIGWFVTAGNVTNRRASNTSWTPTVSGPQTIIVTGHGVSSRGFSLDVIDVQAN